MKKCKLESRFSLRRESFSHAGFNVEILLPASSEALLDEAEFDADERLPYWAELWPSARALTRLLLEWPGLPTRAIELGCGVALPALALRHRKLAVLATDYYEDALLFARRNAELNKLTPLQTRLLDWRRQPPVLPPFPLVVAADVLYEARNAEALFSLLPQIVAPKGSVLLADPGRVHLFNFLERMARSGWRLETLPERLEPSPAGKGLHLRVRMIHLRPPRGHHRPPPKL
jgi:predicted nicotinamide N-methyase